MLYTPLHLLVGFISSYMEIISTHAHLQMEENCSENVSRELTDQYADTDNMFRT